MENNILDRVRRFLGDTDCIRWDQQSLQDYLILALQEVYVKAPYLISNSKEIEVKKGEISFQSEDTIFKVQGIVSCDRVVKIKEDDRDRFFNFDCNDSNISYSIKERGKKILFSKRLDKDTKFLISYFNEEEIDFPLSLSSIIFNLVIYFALSSELDPNNENMVNRYYNIANNDLAVLLGIPNDRPTKR